MILSTKNKPRHELIVRLWDSIRRLQQLNRQPSLAISPKLGLRETFVLFYIDAHPNCSIAQMRKFHQFHQSVGSVLIAELVKKGLIKHSDSQIDAREKCLKVTPKGEKFLSVFDASQQKQMNKNLSAISKSDIIDLEKFLAKIADALSVPFYPVRKGELPIRSQMKRVFIALGFLQNDFASSGLTLTQYQLLSELKSHPHISAGAAIGRRIGADPRGIVFQVRALKRKGLLVSHDDSSDKRRNVLLLTKKGSALVDNVQSRIYKSLETGTLDLSIQRLSHCVSLIEKVTGTGAFDPDQKAVTIKQIKTPNEFKLARAFYVEELVRRNAHKDLSHEILPLNRKVIVAIRDGSIVALIEYQKSQNGWKQNILLAKSSEEEKLPKYKFVERAKQIV